MYQGPDQIKFEIVASPIWTSGGNGRTVNLEKFEKWGIFNLQTELSDLNENLINRRISCLRALILNHDRIRWQWGELEEETGNFGKCLEWRIVMKLGGRSSWLFRFRHKCHMSSWLLLINIKKNFNFSINGVKRQGLSSIFISPSF